MPFAGLVGLVLVGLFLAFALIMVTGEPQQKRAGMRREVWVSLCALTVIALGSIVWQETALRRYARQEGSEIRGLVMRPVPLTNDHEFTPNGRQYLRGGIITPVITGLLSIALVAVASTIVLYARDFRRLIAAIWLYAGVAIGAVAYCAAWRLFQVVELFI